MENILFEYFTTGAFLGHVHDTVSFFKSSSIWGGSAGCFSKTRTISRIFPTTPIDFFYERVLANHHRFTYPRGPVIPSQKVTLDHLNLPQSDWSPQVNEPRERKSTLPRPNKPFIPLFDKVLRLFSQPKG